MARWNPWSALAARPDIVLEWAGFEGTLLGLCDIDERGGCTITLSSALDRRERNAVLAHELVHAERGGGIDYVGAPPAWAAVVAREEQCVDRVTACRLVPTAELREFARARTSTGDAVTAVDVMEEWDVPDWVAWDAYDAAHSPGGPRR